LPALVVFVIPIMIARFGMMAGNWAQHAFIDAASPENCYRNSITCINCVYNRRCFNDGYHIGHHLKANRHWTEMPIEFQNNLETYAREGAIVFEGVDFFVVWFFLMTRNYKALARHYVPLGTETPSTEQIIALLRERTRRIDCSGFRRVRNAEPALARG
jgi:fatty acid desaturase